MIDKEKLIKLLQAKRKIAHELSSYYDNQKDERHAREYLNKACTYTEMILLLEDEEFFELSYIRYVKDNN